MRYEDPNKPGPIYTNVAFPYHLAHDKRMVGLEIRNTNYKAHAEGSDRSNGVWHSNLPAKLDRIVMVESALDALSFQELRKSENTLFVSYGGNLTINQIQTIKELKAKSNTDENFQYVTANDNDKKGAYYDFMFIRELAAKKFPSQRLANPKNSIKLAFASLNAPNPGAIAPSSVMGMADKLMHELKPYNIQIDDDIKKEGLSNLVKNELEKDKIKFKAEGNQFLVEIPTSYYAMHQFNKALILATGLEQQIKIEKAVLNDFNEDLKLLKAVNKNPDLLADINIKKLQKEPEQKLEYSDLKNLILQPGQYEQFQKLFHLSKANEESQEVLKKENRDILLIKKEFNEGLNVDNQPYKQANFKEITHQVRPKF